MTPDDPAFAMEKERAEERSEERREVFVDRLLGKDERDEDRR